MLALALALLIAAAATFILPIVSIMQSVALRRRLDWLEGRLRDLEGHMDLPPKGGSHEEARLTASAPPSRFALRRGPPKAASDVSSAAEGGKAMASLAEARFARRRKPSATTEQEPSATTDLGPRATAGDLESAIGSRWMLYAGITVLLLGLSFFLKLAIDNEWITQTTRVLLGCAAGIALVAGGVSFVRRGYIGYGQILAGGGVAVLYFSVYAAFAFYDLLPQQAAFGLLIVVTLAAAALADRQASQALALVAIAGGFATPFLVGREGGSHLVLFTYDAILIAGTMILARRRAWPLLNLASFGLTLFTVTAWYVRSYQPSLYLSLELFLTLFCAMFLWVRYQGRHSTEPFGVLSRRALPLAPVFYHAASLYILDRQATAYLIYLTAFTAAGVAAGVQRQNPWLRLIVWLAVWLPALGWIDDHANAEWLSRIGATIGAIYAMHLMAQLKTIGDNERLRDAEIALLHLNGLGLLAALYLALENTRPSWVPTAAFALAAWHAALAMGVRRRDLDAALHWIALAGALAATAVALQFDGTWVTVGWAAEGAGLVWLGLRVSRGWLRLAGGLLLTLAALRVVGPDYDMIRVGFTPIANARFAAGVLVVALLYWIADRYRAAAASGTDVRSSSLAVALVGASLLTLALLTQEIMAYWPRHESVATSLMREALISITWAVYAAGLIAAGICRGYAPIRYLAIVVFGLTVIKAFTVDLANLGGIYRVLGFVVVGAVLLGASFLYQRQLKGRDSRS